MAFLLKYTLLIPLHLGLITEGVDLTKDLPVPWRDAEACQVHNEYFIEDPIPITVCDPDETLPPIRRMIASDMLHHCKENSADDTTFFLLLVNNISHAVIGTGSESKAVKQLTEKGLATYNVTQEASAIFMVVGKEPFNVSFWYSDSLQSSFSPSTDQDTLLSNLSESFSVDNNFPLAVNRLIYFFCKKVHAPPYRPAKWDALTLVWMIFVIILIALVTGTVIHLIMVRYKAVHKVDSPGELRQIRGRPSLGPLSMEMEDFGSTPFQPSGNLLLSTADVTAVTPHQQSSSSRANLLDS
ncbi:uncharacterized protein [Palaemon carinicauda]|uniref:uncharacterized protein n=1 Tax=Palaemon carinicauda TaxID=392227 RepID=UPI0035B62C03